MPQWWLEEAAKFILFDRGRERTTVELDDLGVRLAKRIHRPMGWHRTSLAAFARSADPKAKNPADATLELVAALQLEFPRLPHAIYFARSRDESDALAEVWQEFDRLEAHGLPSISEQRKIEEERERERAQQERDERQAKAAQDASPAFRRDLEDELAHRRERKKRPPVDPKR